MSYKEGKMDNKSAPPIIDISDMPTLRKLERQYVELVLGKTMGSKTETAKILGVTVKTVYNKLGEYEAEDKAEPKA
jgi:DNA-binding NtrC family response regulator